MGGVRAICGPIFSNISRSAFPRAFSAVSSTLNSPSAGTRPVIRPVRGFELQPFGKPLRPVRHRAFAAGHDRHQKGIARAGAVYTSGLSICGVSGLAGVRIYLPLEIGLARDDGLHLSARGDLHLQPVGMVVHRSRPPASSTSSRTLSRPDKSTSDARAASPLRMHTAVPQHLPVAEDSEPVFPGEQVFISSAPPPPRRWRRHRRRARTAYG